MGEAKRRKNSDSEYGKLKLVQLSKLTYTAPTECVELCDVLSAWKRQVRSHPKLLAKNLQKYLSLDHNPGKVGAPQNIKLPFYVEMVTQIYREFSHYISDAGSIADMRCLEGEDNSIYAIASAWDSCSVLGHEGISYLNFFAVNPLYLGQGIGTLFMKYIASEFGQKMISKVYLESTYFFKKQGFDLLREEPQIDADYYIATHLDAPYRIEKLQVEVPLNNYSSRVLNFPFLFDRDTIHNSMYSVKTLFPEHVRISFKDVDNETLYWISRDGLFHSESIL